MTLHSQLLTRKTQRENQQEIGSYGHLMLRLTNHGVSLMAAAGTIISWCSHMTFHLMAVLLSNSYHSQLQSVIPIFHDVSLGIRAFPDWEAAPGSYLCNDIFMRHQFNFFQNNELLPLWRRQHPIGWGSPQCLPLCWSPFLSLWIDTQASQIHNAVLVGQRQLLSSVVGELEGTNVISGSTVAAVNKIVVFCENGSEGFGDRW